MPVVTVYTDIDLNLSDVLENADLEDIIEHFGVRTVLDEFSEQRLIEAVRAGWGLDDVLAEFPPNEVETFVAEHTKPSTFLSLADSYKSEQAEDLQAAMSKLLNLRETRVLIVHMVISYLPSLV